MANEEPQAISRDETKQKPSQNSKFYQAALPWYVYGEGKPFETWNSDSGQGELTSFPEWKCPKLTIWHKYNTKFSGLPAQVQRRHESFWYW